MKYAIKRKSSGEPLWIQENPGQALNPSEPVYTPALLCSGRGTLSQ
jgi:hypothetical protein